MDQFTSTPTPPYYETPRTFWKCWLESLFAKTGQLAARGRLRKELGRMTERDLKDIGLIPSDVHRITCGFLPPTDRPSRR